MLKQLLWKIFPKNAIYSCQQRKSMLKNLNIRREHKIPGSIYFSYVGEITEGEAMEFQQESGFHPHGYGFYGYNYKNSKTYWNCSNFCE